MTEEEIFGNRPWLEPEDLPEEGLNVTIAGVEKRPSGRNRDPKTEVRFNELEKTLTLFWQHFKKIKELTGEANTDNWIGLRIKLVRVTQIVNGIEGKPYISIEPADDLSKKPAAKKPTLTRRTPTPAGITVDDNGKKIPF
jgi:hypothetical protein